MRRKSLTKLNIDEMFSQFVTLNPMQKEKQIDSSLSQQHEERDEFESQTRSVFERETRRRLEERHASAEVRGPVPVA